MNDQQKQKVKQPQFIFSKMEIYVHLVIIAIHLTLITKLIIDYAEQHPQTTTPSFLTSLIGKERDSHDIQWETYRSNLPILASVILLWHFLSKLIEKHKNQKSYLFGFLIILYSFRSDTITYLAFIFGWYYFTIKLYKHKHFVKFCWIITIGTLYLNQWSNHFAWLSEMVGISSPFWWFNGNEQRQINCAQILNLTFLKLLSFALDKNRGSEQRQLEKHRQNCIECKSTNYTEYCLKGRNLVSTQDYSLKSYFNYILFAPTLLTGPPLTYKNYQSFNNMKSTKHPQLFKTAMVLISFQIYQHYAPVISLNQTQTFIQAEVITLFHLIFIWYKFLIIWRIAKLWAQFCGIEVIDNLSRCVCNNYGFQGFWRMWHRGFNQWLVRYLYIPLGGNKQVIMSTISVIAFVAFWHDHTVNIVIWAFTFILFILPQILIKKYTKKYFPHLFKKQWFKYTAALTSAFYIYLLVYSNIIGFGYGVDKAYILWQKVWEEWLSVFWSLAVLSSAVILMFYQRSLEGDRNF